MRHRSVQSLTQLKIHLHLTTLIFAAFVITGLRTTNAQTHSENRGLRLAQDFFHSVKKTATPFAPPAPQNDSIKTVGTNLSAFGVPFKVNAADESFVEVQLYLSRDQGKTWSFHSRRNTDQKDFPFQAEQDGEYWFSLKTLDRDRRLLPPGDPQTELKIIVDTVKPTLDFRVETDAAGRVVCRWTAEDKNLLPDTLRMLYQPIDQSGIAKEWTQVPVSLNGTARVGVYSDQIAWWPETTERQLTVAVEIKDIAGNVTQVQREVVVPQTGWRHRANSTAQITDQPQSQPAKSWTPAEQRDPSGFEERESSNPKTASQPPNVVCENGVCEVVPDEFDSGTSAQFVGSEVEYAAPPTPDGFVAPAPQTADPFSNATNAINQSTSNSVPWPSDLEQRNSRDRETVGTTIGNGGSYSPDPSLAPQTNPTQQLAKPVTNVPSNPATMEEVGDQVVGESSTMGQTNQYRGLNSSNGATLPPPSLLPNVPGVDVKRLLKPQVPGQSQGNSWAQPQQTSESQNSFSNAGFPNPSWQDQQRESVVTNSLTNEPSGPMQIIGSHRFRLDYGIDAIDPSGVARVDLWMTRDGRNWSSWGSDPDNQSPFPVEVQEEGQYGFCIVVHSKDGLTGQGPSTGDEADMWVLVDTVSPLVSITSVPYGRGDEAGRLVVNYSVADEHLSLRPINISYSPNSNGPWNPIGEGLRNESRFVWKPKSNVPDLIYLRIEALDKAGNVGVHALSQAIDVSGLVPRGTIRGVTPVKHSR